MSNMQQNFDKSPKGLFINFEMQAKEEEVFVLA
jgi:hypothetical protein